MLTPDDFAKLAYRADEAVAAICGLGRDADKADAIVLALWRDLSKPHYDALVNEVATLRAEVAALRREREYLAPRRYRQPLRTLATAGERGAYNAGYQRGYHAAQRRGAASPAR